MNNHDAPIDSRGIVIFDVGYSSKIAGGTSAVQKNMIGERVLQLPMG